MGFRSGTRGAMFVVRRADGWWTGESGDAELEARTLDAVWDLLRAGAVGGPDGAQWLRPDDGSEPLRRMGIVAPAPYVVGRVEGSHVLVDGPDGAPARLDAVDLAVLDCVTTAQVLEDLDLPIGLDEASARLARLGALGCLIVRGAGTSLDAVPPPRYVQDAAKRTTTRSVDLDAGTSPPVPPGRIPVYFPWPEGVAPLLSLGMLAAAARWFEDGRLNERYEIRHPELAGACLRDLEGRVGPAVLICSDYVYTLPQNLEMARTAKALNPDLVIVHGGPSSPTYEQDVADFFADFGDVADILCRGEGEELLAELLDVAGPDLPRLDPDRLREVGGIIFRDHRSGEIVRTPDRERIADLDRLPSPYLTGEFDHLDRSLWIEPPMFETNRGCPYGCTYCDWGSATMSRIRRFDIDRIIAEFEWAVSQGLGVMLCDANFGILARDVEIARRVVELHARYGGPTHLLVTPSKNRITHLTEAFDVLYEAGITPLASISLQTTDETTLEAIARKNISTDAYLALAATLRRRNHALVGDLIVGLPGQTYRSYVQDLQFMLDHEIMPRTFPLRMLPNSPMNEPGYKERYGVRVNEAQVVAATATLSEEERARVMRMHRVEIVAERAGLLRHIMRYLQWDLGVSATEVLERIITMCDESPERYPSVAWVFTMFDVVPAAPLGWASFYDEVVEFLARELGIEETSALRTVVAVQQAVMPATGRRYPATIQLPHDYVAYYASATRSLHMTGRAGTPDRPLAEYPAASFTVAGDPLDLGGQGLHYQGDTRAPQAESDFHTGGLAANELDSPLLRRLPPLAAFESPSTRTLLEALDLPPHANVIAEEEALVAAPSGGVAPQPVSLRRGGSLPR